MKIQKTVISAGDGVAFPNAGDSVTVDYVLWLYAAGRPDGKGREIDSSRARGPFTTDIGMGKVIRGWDILIPQMSLGEKSLLMIPSCLAYTETGFPGLIPLNTDLVFEVELRQVAAPKTTI